MFNTLLLGVLVIVVQAVGGSIIWLAVKRTRPTSLIELVGIGIGLGAVVSLLAGQVLIPFGIAGVGWVVTILLAFLIVLLGRFAGLPLSRPLLDSRSRWVSVIAVFLAGCVALIPGLLRTPLSGGYVTGSRYHGDLVFFEAVAQFVSRTGPGESSLLADYGIRYHWFAYGWIGSLTDVIGADPFMVMTRIFPVVMVAGASFLAVAWAGQLSRRTWTPLLAGLLVVVAGFLGADQGVVLNFDSPSTSFAAVLALAFAVVLTDFLKSSSTRWPTIVVLAILAVGITGAKASQAVVVLGGLVVTSLASVRMSRDMRIRVLMVLGATGLAVAITYVLVFAGVATSNTNIALNLTGEKASTFQGLDPFTGALGGVLGSLVLILAILPRWLGEGWLAGDRETRWNPETAFGVGVAMAGILPVLVLSSGTNAGWFAVAASPLLGVLSAVGLERAWRHTGDSPRRFLILAALAAVAVNGAVFVAYGLGVVSGAPVLWRAPVLAWIVTLVLALGISRAEKTGSPAALRWLAAVTSVLVFASIGARFSGSAAWSLTQEQFTPAFKKVLSLTDPSAEFSPDSHPSLEDPVGETGSNTMTVSADVGVAGSTADLLQWSPDLNEAAVWLDSHVAPEEIVAVDATYLQPFLPVVTDLTIYVAGEPYISGYTTKEGVQAAHVRERRVQEFLESPSADAAQALWTDDVRWLWLQMTPQSMIKPLLPWASVVRASDHVTILRLNDPDANFE